MTTNEAYSSYQKYIRLPAMRYYTPDTDRVGLLSELSIKTTILKVGIKYSKAGRNMLGFVLK